MVKGDTLSLIVHTKQMLRKRKYLKKSVKIKAIKVVASTTVEIQIMIAVEVKSQTIPLQIQAATTHSAKAGETHTKVINGVNRKWCNICKLWNKTHLTADHRGRRPAANNVSEEGDANGTPAQGLNFAEQIRAQLGQQRS